MIDFCCILQKKLLNNETMSLKSVDGRSLPDEMKETLKQRGIANRSPYSIKLKIRVPVSTVNTSLLSQLRGDSYPQFDP